MDNYQKKYLKYKKKYLELKNQYIKGGEIKVEDDRYKYILDDGYGYKYILNVPSVNSFYDFITLSKQQEDKIEAVDIIVKDENNSLTDVDKNNLNKFNDDDDKKKFFSLISKFLIELQNPNLDVNIDDRVKSHLEAIKDYFYIE